MWTTQTIPEHRLLAFAHRLAGASAEAILPYFRKAIRVDNKAGAGAFDPVTAADRDAENVIERMLAAEWPDHGLEGEEGARRNLDARYRWIVDPIDGTRAFITGAPLWGTLIGVLDKGEPLLGLMNQPYTRERFWSSERGAHTSEGANPERLISTRPCARLEDAVLSATHPDMFRTPLEIEAFARVKTRVRMTRFGGDCYAYCLLAAGFIDLIVEADLMPHDIAALVPIIEKAGGRVTTWDGQPAIAGGRVIAAGDPRLHEAALNILGG